MAARRHLPLVGQRPAPSPGSLPDPELELGADADRAPWHWAAIGTLSIFVLWLPLAMVGQWVGARLVAALSPGQSPADVAARLASSSSGERAAFTAALLVPQVVSFALACTAGGAFVGRFGRRAGRREATAAGIAAATVACALAAAGQGGLAALAVLWPPVALLGAAFGYLGGHLGLARRSTQR